MRPCACAIFLLAVAAAGCGDEEQDWDIVCFQCPGVPGAPGENQYVLDLLLLPTTPTKANLFGLNLDSDEQGRPDNQFGAFLSALTEAVPTLDLQMASDALIARGEALVLVDVAAPSLPTATGVGVRFYLGQSPSVSPCDGPEDIECRNHLDGMTSFGLDPRSPTDALIVGQVVGGKFNGGPGNVAIQLPLFTGAAPLIPLIGARAEIGSVTADELTNGKLGGAVTQEVLQSQLLPGLVDLLNSVIADGCAEPPTPEEPCRCRHPSAVDIIALLDVEVPRCEITVSELIGNELLGPRLELDVDLIDQNGRFEPRRDGVADSLSVGFAFDAVGAEFDIP